MEHKIVCKCGKRDASFIFKDEILPRAVIKTLYCPDCSRKIAIDYVSMIKDNGWIIRYDMDIVRLYRHKLPLIVTENLLPDTLFDNGFATWRGVYPGDHIDSKEERQALAKLAKKDPKKYFKDITTWSIKRMERLRKDGWRKAREQEAA
jgi:hypothetical protein